MPCNSNTAAWPGSLEAAAFYERARETAEELLRQLRDRLQADEDEEGGEIHWGHVGKVCQINALLTEALRVPAPARTSSSGRHTRWAR